jgi:hypothetical protein
MEYFKIYFTMLNLVGILFAKKLIGVQAGRGRRGVAQGVAANARAGNHIYLYNNNLL